jgi:hypothetical protein
MGFLGWKKERKIILTCPTMHREYIYTKSEMA